MQRTHRYIARKTCEMTAVRTSSSGGRAMQFSPIDLIASLLFTWVIGLAPAFLARRVQNGPLSRKRATWIAVGSCFILALLGLMLKAAAGEPNPRVSPAWILVFLASRWIMIRHKKPLDADGARVAASQLSRDNIISRLREMIADPATSEQHRTQAQVRLEEFERRASQKAERNAQSNLKRWIRRARPSRSKSLLLMRVLAFVIFADLMLMISGYRLLIHERAVQPGQSYSAGHWGDLGSYERETIACWYWTGRRLLPEAFWYGAGKSERDECSFLHKHKPGE